MDAVVKVLINCATTAATKKDGSGRGPGRAKAATQPATQGAQGPQGEDEADAVGGDSLDSATLAYRVLEKLVDSADKSPQERLQLAGYVFKSLMPLLCMTAQVWSLEK